MAAHSEGIFYRNYGKEKKSKVAKLKQKTPEEAQGPGRRLTFSFTVVTPPNKPCCGNRVDALESLLASIVVPDGGSSCFPLEPICLSFSAQTYIDFLMLICSCKQAEEQETMAALL